MSVDRIIYFVVGLAFTTLCGATFYSACQCFYEVFKK